MKLAEIIVNVLDVFLMVIFGILTMATFVAAAMFVYEGSPLSNLEVDCWYVLLYTIIATAKFITGRFVRINNYWF